MKLIALSYKRHLYSNNKVCPCILFAYHMDDFNSLSFTLSTLSTSSSFYLIYPTSKSDIGRMFIVN